VDIKKQLALRLFSADYFTKILTLKQAKFGDKREKEKFKFSYAYR
jgi:hypothetical protein